MKRRAFFTRTATIAAVPLGLQLAAGADAGGLIDCNVYLGPHPFRTLPWSNNEEVVANLRKRGVTQAWAGAIEGLLQRELGQVNARLASECKKSGGLLLATGSINPMLPNWRDDLNRCTGELGMKAIRLHPNFHGYTLADPVFAELLEAATAQKVAMQIVAQMEDQRTQHPLVQVAPVDLKALPDALKKIHEARVMVLNANRAMSMTALRGCPVWLDIAMLEGVGGVENLLTDWPAEKVVFGSYAPFFYWESARLKLQESALEEAKNAAILQGNAAAFLQA